MTIDSVRSTFRTEPVRRLFRSAPSADDLRSAFSEGLDTMIESAPSADELRSAITDGLGTLNEGLGAVAERVDRSAEAIRERVPMPDLPFRPKPARTGPPRPLIALAGAAAVLAVGFLLGRMDRLTWTSLRDRFLRVARRTTHRAGALGSHLANLGRGAAAIGTQAISPTAPVTDDVLEERVRSALGREKGLYAIKIEADDGVVRVQGRVEPGEREHALATLRAVPGVRDIEDRLAVTADTGADGAAPSGPNGSGSTLAADEVTARDELTAGIARDIRADD